MSIRLGLGTVGRYCVTKAKVRLYSLHFSRRAWFLFSNVISESVAVIRLSGYPRSIRLAKMRDLSLESAFRGVCTENSKCFALDEAFFDP